MTSDRVIFHARLPGYQMEHVNAPEFQTNVNRGTPITNYFIGVQDIKLHVS